jgi:hypothetical protein
MIAIPVDAQNALKLEVASHTWKKMEERKSSTTLKKRGIKVRTTTSIVWSSLQDNQKPNPNAKRISAYSL